MISKIGKDFDIVIITASHYADHPFSPSGVIAKILDNQGYNVGIIEKPTKDKHFKKLGKPKLCFCITSGCIDSMLNNYTPLKKPRKDDPYSNYDPMPDRAVIFYCNKIKENFKDTKLIIGGTESTLRRFAHYDYWDNKIRRSILLDSRADILVYGNGEKQIIKIAERLNQKKDLDHIKGTCIIKKDIDDTITLLPSFKSIRSDPKLFAKMQSQFSNSKDLAQKYDNRYVVQYQSPIYTTEDLDHIYSLDYSRKLSPDSPLKMAQFSVVTHRGCIGNCNFCSIALTQGPKIISRSEKNILEELEKISKMPHFKGTIDDLGGPAANMYGMDCEIRCDKNCISCKNLDTSHKKIISLLKKAQNIDGIKKIYIRSGIRYDLAIKSPEYIKEISEHHISGSLKIAPEHFSKKVLNLMNKDNSRFDEFKTLFNKINKDKNQYLKYYLMICHPGDDMAEMKKLIKKTHQLKNIESFQLFTPSPMSNSTCMYHTGYNPITMKKIDCIHDYKTKKVMKRLMLNELKKHENTNKHNFYHKT